MYQMTGLKLKARQTDEVRDSMIGLRNDPQCCAEFSICFK